MKTIDVSTMYTSKINIEFLPRFSPSSTKGVGVKKNWSKYFFQFFFISFCILTVDRFMKYNQVLIFPKDMISAI